jgi:ureidoglycolate hydrolase
VTDELMIRQIMVEPLDPDLFHRFGTVIRAESLDAPTFNRAPGNMGVLWVQHPIEFPKQAYLGALRYYYRGARCDFLQRHPESTVVLIPLGRPSIVFAAGAADDGRPSTDDIHAFLLDGSAGVAFHRNVWLRYAYPLGDYVDFAYITQRVDPATANSTDDTQRFRLDDELSLVIEFAFMPPRGAGFEYGAADVVRAGPGRNPPWE